METETITEQTPMKKVWKIITATMIGTLLIGYGLHEMSMTKLRTQNAREREDAQLNIIKLTEYRDQLQASTTAAHLPQ
jgi:hypothetical protein